MGINNEPVGDVSKPPFEGVHPGVIATMPRGSFEEVA